VGEISPPFFLGPLPPTKIETIFAGQFAQDWSHQSSLNEQVKKMDLFFLTQVQDNAS